jgi:heme oxygenase
MKKYAVFNTYGEVMPLASSEPNKRIASGSGFMQCAFKAFVDNSDVISFVEINQLTYDELCNTRTYRKYEKLSNIIAEELQTI